MLDGDRGLLDCWRGISARLHPALFRVGHSGPGVGVGGASLHLRRRKKVMIFLLPPLTDLPRVFPPLSGV